MSDDGSRTDRLLIHVGKLEARIDAMADETRPLRALDQKVYNQDQVLEALGNSIKAIQDAGGRMPNNQVVEILARLEKLEKRVDAVEDCITTPTNGTNEITKKDPLTLQVLRAEFVAVLKSAHTDMPMGEVNRFASRMANSLWRAGYNTREKLHKAKDPKLLNVKGLGSDGVRILRYAFPRQP